MAAPRVFISSTYYDLRHVRDDIEIFIKGLGYVPVMHDKRNITYTQGETSLEQSCYNELASCDIVVCIIGGNYGTQSSGSDYSITMEELQEAIRRRKMIYVYVLKNVLDESLTYMNNRENNFNPYHVNDIRVLQFILELNEKVKNAPIQPFESVSDITINLCQQFAGMFQYLLNKESTITETKTFEDLQSVAIQIKDFANCLREENQDFFNKFKGTILAQSPVIRKILEVIGIKYFGLFAPTRTALTEFLTNIGYTEDTNNPLSCIFSKQNGNTALTLTLSNSLFDENDNIKDIRDNKSISEYITFKAETINDDDELPF